MVKNYVNLAGDKRYELSNHLENVLAVISDRKIPQFNTDALPSSGLKVFNPEVLSYSDYYPFGQLVPNRHGSSNSYKFGFNGKEMDNELKGEGNSYDFGDRMLDPRIGRWFAPDKMEGKYPSMSTYNAFADNPMFFIDPDGNDIESWKWFRSIFGFSFGPFYSLSDHYNSDVKFDQTYQKTYKSSNIFRKIISRLENSSRTYKFSSTYHSSLSADNVSEGGHFDPNHKGTEKDPYTINFMIDYKMKTTTADDRSVLFEETFHAAQNDYALSTKTKISDLATEIEAKLVKNIEGNTSKNSDYNYEVMSFKGSKEIFTSLRTGKKLTDNQKGVLGREIIKLAKSVSDVYNDITDRYNVNTFNPETDLKFAE